ncbi:MAG TPA: hypothetical protein VKQ32_22070 [Polyangia bacterium]|nr:hypothetical protein [Polyangia bacterium]
MIIISGSSPKAQVLGYPTVPCPICRQATLHRFERRYRIKHLFWFPLFSTGTSYAKVCEMCQVSTPTGPPTGPVPPAPFLHRLGFIFPLAVVLFPLVMLPFALVAAVHGVAASGGAQAAVADTEGPAVSFRPTAADMGALSDLEGFFEDRDLHGVDADWQSATVDGHTVRLVTVKYAGLKKVKHSDRLYFMEQIEQIADGYFRDDEVFIGLQGRLLWGGYSHRKAGEKWVHVAQESTLSAETEARAAVRVLERAASTRPAAPATAAAAGATAP